MKYLIVTETDAVVTTGELRNQNLTKALKETAHILNVLVVDERPTSPAIDDVGILNYSRMEQEKEQARKAANEDKANLPPQGYDHTKFSRRKNKR